jgi:hypothetical protein
MKQCPLSLSFAAGAALLLTAGAVRAQPSPGEESVRQQLLDQMEQAHRRKAHGEALQAAQQAARIRRSPTLTLFIAGEQEELGAFADAYTSGQQCLREAQLDVKAINRDQTLQACQRLVDRLKAKVGYVVINAPDAPAGLSIKLSGHELNHAVIGIPYVITPGSVTIEASAPNRMPYSIEVAVSQGQLVTVNLNLPPQPAPVACPLGEHRDASGKCVADTCRVGMVSSADGAGCCWPGQTWDPAGRSCQGVPRCPPGFESADGTCLERTAEGSPGDVEGDQGERSPRRWYGVALAAVGGAALAPAGVTWLVANSRYNQLSSACDLRCEVMDRRRRIDGIKKLDDWALGTAIAGGVLAAGGAVIAWTSWPRQRETTVSFDPASRTLLLGGRF